MTKPALNPAGVLAALEKIRVPNSPNAMRRCILRMRLISHFAKYDKGEIPIQKGFEPVADQVGMAVRTVRLVLDELVADKVMQREPGAGSRAASYRLEPDVRRWRGFEWAVPVSMVEQEVGFATGEFKVESSRQPRTAWSARQKRFVGHSMGDRPISKSQGTPWGASQTKPLSAKSPGRVPHKSLGSSISEDAESVSASLTEEGRELVHKVGWLIVREFKGHFFNGGPKNTLTWLVQQGATEDELMELLAAAPRDGMQVPSAVNWIHQQWRLRNVQVTTNEVIDITEPDPAERERNRQLQAQNWRNQIQWHEAQGNDREAEDFRQLLANLEETQMEA